MYKFFSDKFIYNSDIVIKFRQISKYKIKQFSCLV